MEFLFMITGNGLPATSTCDERIRERDDGRALRDIQNLIAKLEVVNRLLSVPVRARPVPLPLPAETDSAGAESQGA